MQCHLMMQTLKFYCKMCLPLFAERQGHDESGYRDFKDYYLRVKQIKPPSAIFNSKTVFHLRKGVNQYTLECQL